MDHEERVAWWRLQADEFRQRVAEATDDELADMLRRIDVNQEEWQWSTVADEINRRRKARRLAREAREAEHG